MEQYQLIDTGSTRCCVVNACAKTRISQFVLKYIVAIHTKRMVFTKSVTGEFITLVYVDRPLAVNRQLSPPTFILQCG